MPHGRYDRKSEREKENLDLKVEVKRAINMVVREAMKESRGEANGCEASEVFVAC